jgi:c-di-GMP-binding flagellar brake protein YcgR
MFLAGSKKESCRTLDISRAGACLICSCLLKTDAQVDLRLELFPKKNSIRAKARVAWIKYIEDVKTGANHYKVGVEFLGLRPDDKRRISRLVQSLS